MWGKISFDFADQNIQKKFEEEQKEKEEKIKKRELAKKQYGDFSMYYEEWYFDKQWNVNEKLFREYAQDIVKKLSQEKETTTKLRQYYNVVNDLYQTHRSPSKEKLYLMLAKAGYDLGRKKLKRTFYQFLKINVDIVLEKNLWWTKNKVQKFDIFKKHFEAVVAYAKGVLNV